MATLTLGAAVVGAADAASRASVTAGARAPLARDSVWVTVEREATLGSGADAEAVRRDALYGALADAVARVAGVAVQSQTMAVRADRDGSVQESFVRALHVEGRGTAIAWQVLSERWEVRRSGGRRAGTGVPTFRLRVRVLVARTVERPDPAFRASVRVSSPVCIVRGAALVEGDEVAVSVMASEDVHWVVVSVKDDSVDVLAPNVVEQQVTSRAGAWRTVPADSLRAQGVTFRCALPASRVVSREMVIAVATRTSIPPPGSRARGASPDTPRISLAEFNQWLAAIPPHDRTLAETALEVRAQR
jgi:hypothetical protein